MGSANKQIPSEPNKYNGLSDYHQRFQIILRKSIQEFTFETKF